MYGLLDTIARTKRKRSFITKSKDSAILSVLCIITKHVIYATHNGIYVHVIEEADLSIFRRVFVMRLRISTSRHSRYHIPFYPGVDTLYH